MGRAFRPKSISAATSGPTLRAARRQGLGCVDKVPDPQSDGRDEDEAEEAVGGLVVAGGQPSAVFEL
jgi:hypothetical protein